MTDTVPEVRLSWNHAICERCWCEQNGGDSGPWREPARVRDVDGAKQCTYCGYPTWAGIFCRDDPKNVAYPQPKDDE